MTNAHPTLACLPSNMAIIQRAYYTNYRQLLRQVAILRQRYVQAERDYCLARIFSTSETIHKLTKEMRKHRRKFEQVLRTAALLRAHLVKQRRPALANVISDYYYIT